MPAATTSRTVEAVDRDLKITVDRRGAAHRQISKLQASIVNDDRSLNRLLDERLQAALPQVPVVPVDNIVG